MFVILVDRQFDEERRYVECGCVSTDTKLEENFVTMSLCVEADTGKTYFFNESGTAGSKWVEQFSFKS